MCNSRTSVRLGKLPMVQRTFCRRCNFIRGISAANSHHFGGGGRHIKWQARKVDPSVPIGSLEKQSAQIADEKEWPLLGPEKGSLVQTREHWGEKSRLCVVGTLPLSGHWLLSSGNHHPWSLFSFTAPPLVLSAPTPNCMRHFSTRLGALPTMHMHTHSSVVSYWCALFLWRANGIPRDDLPGPSFYINSCLPPPPWLAPSVDFHWSTRYIPEDGTHPLLQNMSMTLQTEGNDISWPLLAYNSSNCMKYQTKGPVSITWCLSSVKCSVSLIVFNIKA
jgi:hypothetical protein